jgi:hypothetical protein
MGQLTGRATVTAAGKRLPTKEKTAKINIGGVTRKGEMGDGGVLGYTETGEVPFVECVIAHSANVSLAEINAITDATVSFDTDTKKSYVLRNAWCAKANELDKGDVQVRFEGMACEEV